MVIVIIHWRIKPTAQAESDFFNFWTETAIIEDKSNLAGEFLSQPIPADRFKFIVDDYSQGHSLADCRHFINIGIWKDWHSFSGQVGKFMDDEKPLQDFEAERRTRSVLEPKQFRIGAWELPSAGSCE